MAYVYGIGVKRYGKANGHGLMMSSFQKKKVTVSLPGTRTSLQNGQQLASSGNPALDHILGGGLPIGSILLIEEDKFVRYSDYLTKYFLAEGVVQKHALFVGSLDVDSNETIKKLPLPVNEKEHTKSMTSRQPSSSSGEIDDGMRIAWRYNNLEKIDSVQGGDSSSGAGTNLGHYFDLSQHITTDTISHLDLTCFSNEKGDTAGKETSVFTNSVYANLLKELSDKLKQNSFSIKLEAASTEAAPKNLLRVVLKSVGSPLWWEDNFSHDICLFLITLRALIRNSLAICCLTIPAHLFKHFDETLIHRVRNLVDFAVELESFAGSDKETNPAFKEYHGLIYIRKLSAVNTLAAHSPETHDLAFKLRRKRFVIEKLHLPPELQESDQREQEDEHILSSLSCGSTSKNLLEF